MKFRKGILLIILVMVSLLFTSCSNETNPVSDENKDPDPEETYFWQSLQVPSGVSSAAVDPQLTIWAGTGAGVYKSANGITWEKINTGFTTMINSTLIKSSPTGDIYSIVGTELYYFNRGLNTWQNISQNLNTDLLTFDHMYTFSIDRNGVVYMCAFISEKIDPQTIGVDKPAFFKSTDKGHSWIKVKVKQYEGEVRNVAFDSDNNIFVVMDATVYISKDDGKTFTQTLNGLTGSNPFLLSSNTKNNLYCATGNGLYKSIDNGMTWENSNWDTYCISLGVDASDKVFIGAINRSYYSSNNGVSWTEISSGLSYSLGGFSDCVIQCFDKNSYVYSVLEGVLYRSTNPTTSLQ